MTKQTKDLTEQFKSMLPEIKFNKNGYELRTQILEMAQQQEWQDFQVKLGLYETSVTRDENTLVTTVEMPTAPAVGKILETAQQFYDFVNQKTSK